MFPTCELGFSFFFWKLLEAFVAWYLSEEAEEVFHLFHLFGSNLRILTCSMRWTSWRMRAFWRSQARSFYFLWGGTGLGVKPGAQIYIYTAVTLNSMENGTFWRCISYWKRGYSMAMLVYRRVYIHVPVMTLIIDPFWYLFGWWTFNPGAQIWNWRWLLATWLAVISYGLVAWEHLHVARVIVREVEKKDLY